MADGKTEPCALKRLPYEEDMDKEIAKSELDALLMAKDMPHIVQGLAVFPEHCTDDDRDYLWLATRSVIYLSSKTNAWDIAGIALLETACSCITADCCACQHALNGAHLSKLPCNLVCNHFPSNY